MAMLVVEEVESEIQDQNSDEALYKIIPFPADYTLQVLYEKWKNGEIEIQEEWQRKYVWGVPRASRLIESFLIGLPVPGIFLYRREQDEHLLVVDGQQRLKSVFGYLDNTFPKGGMPFTLKGVRAKWDGKSYVELEHPDQVRLRDSVLRATIIVQTDPKDDTSLPHIFERLNTGGVALTPQEIRHCIYHGPFDELLQRLNVHSDWKAVLGTAHPDDRMRDVELVLRSFALAYAGSNYSKPMKDFLGRFMSQGNKMRPSQLAEYEAAFIRAAGNVRKYLGPKPFHIKRGINAAVCDSVMVAFIVNRDVPLDISSRYQRLLGNDAFKSYVSAGTTDLDTVRQRLALAQNFLFKK